MDNKIKKCMADGLWCPNPTGPLKITVDGESFCSKKCANDFFLETTEGTYQPFPKESNALTGEKIQENEINYYNRYERDFE